MIRAYMSDDITVIYDEGHDDWGEPLPTTNVEMKAYLDWKTHLIRNIAGEQVVSRGTAYVMPARKITHKEIIKYNDVEYAILDIRPGKDFSENHQEVHLA